jgi:hypothetical protein
MIGFRFGFELEGFNTNKDGEVQLPEKGMPLDGFPGLVEVRTSGGQTLEDAIWLLKREVSKYPLVNFSLCRHRFNAADLSLLRRNYPFSKRQVEVNNVYGLKPRLMAGITMSSLQISISRQVAEPYQVQRIDSNGRTFIHSHSAQYGLFDFVPVIRKLDSLFAEPIKRSGRAPGWYAVKGDRVEYRSLPSSVWADWGYKPRALQALLETCFQQP